MKFTNAALFLIRSLTLLSTISIVKVYGQTIKLSAGVGHTCAFDAGTLAELKCWGANAYYQLNTGDQTDQLTPIDVSLFPQNTDAEGGEAGGLSTCMISKDIGGVSCVGYNEQGQLGIGSTTSFESCPVAMTLPPNTKIVSIAVGWRHTCVIDDQKVLYCTGLNNWGQLGANDNIDRKSPVPVHGNVKDVSVGGYDHTCFLNNAFELLCMGSNLYGQLGRLDIFNANTPMFVDLGRRTAKEVACGAYYTCLIDDLGKVLCMGRNSHGELGMGTNSITYVATPLPQQDPNAIAIAAGDAHTCFIVENGKVFCMGSNEYGQLGNGGTTDSNVPVEVDMPLSSSPAKIALGTFHSCVATTDNRIYCWGGNNYGQIGDGSLLNRKTPTLVTLDWNAPPTAPAVVCSTCTLTTGFKSDPHMVPWGDYGYFPDDDDYYDDDEYYSNPYGDVVQTFAGACDMIGFDTDDLQLQVRTRPGGSNGSWSGIVQVGLKWKPTGETIFLFNGSARMTIDNTANYQNILTYTQKPKQSYFGGYNHEFNFLGAPAGKDNLMKIEEWEYGLYNIEIKGYGSTFGGSVGAFGAWNRYNEDNRFTLRGSGGVYYGNDIFDVIESWKVKACESILDEPSDICTSSSSCGGAGEFPCIESGAYRARELQTGFCDKTCDDLTTPLEKQMCKIDVALSGTTDWACQEAYTDPIIYDSEICPSSCKGDVTTEKFPIANLFVGFRKKCEWAIRRPELKENRCSRPEVALNCCASCCSECAGDAAGTAQFLIPELGRRRTCDWAGRKSPNIRCAIDTVARMCCETCAPYFD